MIHNCGKIEEGERETCTLLTTVIPSRAAAGFCGRGEGVSAPLATHTSPSASAHAMWLTRMPGHIMVLGISVHSPSALYFQPWYAHVGCPFTTLPCQHTCSHQPGVLTSLESLYIKSISIDRFELSRGQ